MVKEYYSRCDGRKQSHSTESATHGGGTSSRLTEQTRKLLNVRMNGHGGSAGGGGGGGGGGGAVETLKLNGKKISGSGAGSGGTLLPKPTSTPRVSNSAL